MKASIISKLESLQERQQEIAGLLADPDVIADQNQFRKFSMEYATLEPVVAAFSQYSTVVEDMSADDRCCIGRQRLPVGCAQAGDEPWISSRRSRRSFK